jgi:hypothetical protein
MSSMIMKYALTSYFPHRSWSRVVSAVLDYVLLARIAPGHWPPCHCAFDQLRRQNRSVKLLLLLTGIRDSHAKPPPRRPL